jgi:hypothetical protein
MHQTEVRPAPSAEAVTEHACHAHRPGGHIDACLTGPCGFCGASLTAIGSGECRACLRLLCHRCDSRYQAELGPICEPCTPASAPACGVAAEGTEVYRLCVFEFDLSCGHLVTAARTGLYPVCVACCDRLGGTILRGVYVPYASEVDYVRVLAERYETRPTGTPLGGTRLIGRRARTDEPYQPTTHGFLSSAGRYPARVGATCSCDGSIVSQDAD